MSGAASWQRLAGFHVALECRDDAFDRVGAGFCFVFPFGQRLGDSGKAHKPPAVLLPLQRISVSERHYPSSKSSLLSCSWSSTALRRPGPISFFRSFKVVNRLP